MHQSQQAPLAQRVQFLEAKGLTGPEIEEAMKQANQTSRSQPTAQFQNQFQAYGPAPYPGIHPSQQWDWRDYFVSRFIFSEL